VKEAFMRAMLIMEDGRSHPGFLLRLLATAFGLWVAASIVPGVHIHGFGNILLAAVLIGLVNAIIRPLIVFLTLPLTIVTLGFFLLVVNGAMLGLVATMMESFTISGLIPAILASIVISLVGWLVSR
jgi:putative membrane protein